MTLSQTVRHWLLYRVVPVFLLAWILHPVGVCLAQERGLAFDVTVGPALPLGNLATASGSGATVGFGVQHRLGMRLRLTTDFELSHFWDGHPTPTSADQMSGDFGSTTDLKIWRATAGLVLRATRVDAPWELNIRGGIGVAGIGSGPLPPGSQEPTESATEGLNEDVLALTGGVELGRPLASSSFTPFVRVNVDAYALGDKLVGLAILNPEIPASGWLASVPIRIGVRYRF